MKLGKAVVHEQELVGTIEYTISLYANPSTPDLLVSYLAEVIEKWQEELRYIQEDLKPFLDLEMPTKEFPN